MVVAAPKRERTPAQLANDQRLKDAAIARRQGPIATAEPPEPQPAPGDETEKAPYFEQDMEVLSQTAPPSGRNPALERAEQVFAASAVIRKSTTVRALPTDGTMASDSIDGKRSTVTHITDEKVRMWKPTPAGYRPRWVPGSLSSIMVNLQNGWKTACPDCGTDCGDDPNDCTAHPQSKVAYCPKAGCNHKINLRNLALDLSNTAHADDPNAADLGYGGVDEMKMLKAAMNEHIRQKHPREAAILIGPAQVLVPSGF